MAVNDQKDQKQKTKKVENKVLMATVSLSPSPLPTYCIGMCGEKLDWGPEFPSPQARVFRSLGQSPKLDVYYTATTPGVPAMWAS